MTRTVVARALLVLGGIAVLLAAVLPVAADAADEVAIERDGQPTVVVVNGETLVDAGDVVDEVWIGNGRATVDGRVEGSIVVLNGSAVVGGLVGGDVTVVHGAAWIGSDAVIGGDVRASQPINLDEGAIIEGSVQQTTVIGGLRSVLPKVRTALWIGLTIALLVLGTVAVIGAIGTIDRAGERLMARPIASGVRGLVALVAVPLIALAAFLTTVGGILGLLLLAFSSMAAIGGLVVAATFIGRWTLPGRSAFGAFLLGVVVLRILALVPVVGDILTIAAALFGSGALLLAGRDEGTGKDGADDLATGDTTGANERREPRHARTAAITATVAHASTGSGPNLDLRPRPSEPVETGDRPTRRPTTEPDEPTGPVPTSRADMPPGKAPAWLYHIIGGARSDPPSLDLTEDPPVVRLPGDDPTMTEAAEAAGPRVLAALPIREARFEDDPAGEPGNRSRRSLFVNEVSESPIGPHSTPLAPESPDQAADDADQTRRPDPQSEPRSERDPTRMPTGAPVGEGTDTLLHRPGDEREPLFGHRGESPWDSVPDLESTEMFSRGARAWRPDHHN